MRWRWWCVVAALGCSGPATDAGGRATAPLEPTTRDSAGVTIHEHAADALERAPLLVMDSVPLAVFVGSADSAEGDVSELRFLRFTSSGDLVGFDTQDHAVVILSVDGTPRRSFGRRGAGPAEFGDVEALAVGRGDTVVVYDEDHRRLSLVHPVAGFVGMVSPREIPGHSGLRVLGQTSTGLLLLARSCFGVCHTLGDQSGTKQWPILISTGRPADSSYTLRFELPGQPTALVVFDINGSAAFNGYKVHFTIAPQLHAWGDGVLVALGPDWSVERRDTLGRQTSEIRVMSAVRSVSPELWAASVEERLRVQLEDYPDMAVDAARAELAAEQHTGTVPAFSRVWVTPGDVAWVLDYRLPGDSGWAASAVDLRGRLLGRIVESHGEPPVAFGNDRLALRTEDEDGIATITVRKFNLP